MFFQARTAATCREGDRIRLSLNWLFARRAVLTLGRDRLTIRDWSLPYAEFDRAALVSVRLEFGPQFRLMIWHRGCVYQFQVPSESWWRYVPHPFWSGPLPFPVSRESRDLEWSPSPWLTGVGLVAVALGLLLSRFGW